MSKSNPELEARIGAEVAKALAASKGADLIVTREGRAVVIHDTRGVRDAVTVA